MFYEFHDLLGMTLQPSQYPDIYPYSSGA